MSMRRLTMALVVVTVAGCSGAMESDGGTDAGRDGGNDAGPTCTGVPARLASATCVALESFYAQTCGASPAQALAAHTASCDAGPGILGYVSEGTCPDGLVSVAWVYGFPGDTYECIFAPDAGLVGAINFSDHGTLLAGRVAECTPRPAPSCRDGG